MFKSIKNAVTDLFMLIGAVVIIVLMLIYFAIKKLGNFHKSLNDDSDPKGPNVSKFALEKPGEFKVFTLRRLKNV